MVRLCIYNPLSFALYFLYLLEPMTAKGMPGPNNAAVKNVPPTAITIVLPAPELPHNNKYFHWNNCNHQNQLFLLIQLFLQ